jgi:hypothetical protein
MRQFYFIMAVTLITISFISCREQEPEVKSMEETVVKELSEQTAMNNVELGSTDLKSFHTDLQGDWKRVDYPYGTYEFKGDSVKHVSEGMARQPQFKPFFLADNCPFADSAVARLKVEEVVYVDPIDQVCQRLRVRNDSLFISNMEESYTIVYERQ